MKTNLIILALLLSIYPHRAMANNEDTIPVYKNELRFGAYHLFQQALYVSYERFYRNTSTVISQEITYQNSKGKQINGYYFLLEQRINLYNSTDFPYSVYLAPGIKYRYKDICCIFSYGHFSPIYIKKLHSFLCLNCSICIISGYFLVAWNDK